MYQNVSNSLELRNNTRRYEILHTLSLGCSSITLRESCNNQLPRYKYFVASCYKSYIPRVSELNG